MCLAAGMWCRDHGLDLETVSRAENRGLGLGLRTVGLGLSLGLWTCGLGLGLGTSGLGLGQRQVANGPTVKIFVSRYD